MDVYEAMYTLRSMRRLKPDPVPDALVEKVIDAAVRAPNGGNAQSWAFLVVRDEAKRRKIAAWYLDGFQQLIDSGYTHTDGELTPEQAERWKKMVASGRYLADHMAEVPVLIFACLVTGSGTTGVENFRSGGSIYPAVQNLMLAARAEGLGSTITTIHGRHDDEIKALLKIPAHVVTAAMIPLGWPMGRFGSGPRRSGAEVTYLDAWEQSPSW